MGKTNETGLEGEQTRAGVTSVRRDACRPVSRTISQKTRAKTVRHIVSKSTSSKDRERNKRKGHNKNKEKEKISLVFRSSCSVFFLVNVDFAAYISWLNKR